MRPACTQVNVAGMMPKSVASAKIQYGMPNNGEARLMNQLGKKGVIHRFYEKVCFEFNG